jgi:hypothetical protein
VRPSSVVETLEHCTALLNLKHCAPIPGSLRNATCITLGSYVNTTYIDGCFRWSPPSFFCPPAFYKPTFAQPIITSSDILQGHEHCS